MNKQVFISAMILALMGFGCSSMTKTTTTNETPATESKPDTQKMSYSAYVLTQIKEKTSIPFGNIESTDFVINTAGTDVNVAGYVIKAQLDAKDETSEGKIEAALLAEGFVNDSGNNADGTFVGRRAYIKENNTCHVNTQAIKNDAYVISGQNIQVACGATQL